jgi:hypothetical protein
MKKILASTILLAAFPLVTHAQSFQSLFTNIVIFIDRALIPFLFGIAFLFFVINVFRYFILGGSNPEAQDSAKSLALYGVAAFVFLIIFWGIVNMLVSSLGIGSTPVQSDYMSGARGGSAAAPAPTAPPFTPAPTTPPPAASSHNDYISCVGAGIPEYECRCLYRIETGQGPNDPEDPCGI